VENLTMVYIENVLVTQIELHRFDKKYVTHKLIHDKNTDHINIYRFYFRHIVMEQVGGGNNWLCSICIM
jgi:hypothetical protein